MTDFIMNKSKDIWLILKSICLEKKIKFGWLGTRKALIEREEMKQDHILASCCCYYKPNMPEHSSMDITNTHLEINLLKKKVS